MTILIGKIKTGLVNRKAKATAKKELVRAAEELNRLTDRELYDMGMTPYLVRMGVRGYPWK